MLTEVRPYGRDWAAADTALNRYYDPNTAQFISVDPMVNLTRSPYSFAGDNPLDATDPTGLMLMGCGPDGNSACSCHDLGTCAPPTSTASSAASGAVLGGAGGFASGVKEGSKTFIDQAAEQVTSKTAKQPLEALSKGIVTFGRGFELFGVGLSLTVDVNDHSSVGYMAGDIVGGFVFGGIGAGLGGARCIDKVVGAVPCAIAGGIAFGAFGSYATGFAGDAAEHQLKRLWDSIF